MEITHLIPDAQLLADKLEHIPEAVVKPACIIVKS